MKNKLAGLLGMVMVLMSLPVMPVWAGEQENAPSMEEYRSGGLYMEGLEKPKERRASEEDYVRISIESEEDLYELAQNCSLDIWSADKVIELNADIILTQADFCIPVFSGIFEGNGHSISNYRLTGKQDNMGLFRYVQQGALIRNLSVSGSLSPAGNTENMGGIAGHNYGEIFGCSFQGTAEGDSNIGGITGVNEGTGIIRECENSAMIIGNHSAGGIAGYNLGILDGCINNGEINTYSTEVVYTMEDFTMDSLEEVNSTGNVSAHTDSGGIAGLSEGEIYNCINYGSVGYAHIGYNTGGIAGRQKAGILSGCTNSGYIQGRKDVGGIAGQQEPYLVIEYLDGKLTQLDNELDTMLELFGSLREDMHSYGKEAASLTKSISGNLKIASDAAGELTNTGTELWKAYDQEMTGVSNDLKTLGGALDKPNDRNDNSVVSGGNAGGIAGGDSRLDEITGKLQGYSDAAEIFVKSTGGHVENAVNASNAQREKIISRFHTLDNALGDACTDMERLAALMERQSDSADADLSSISRQAEAVRELTSEIRDDILQYEKAAVEDASDLSEAESADLKQGYIADSINQGRVEADTNTGGITGQIGIEYDIDPEDDVDIQGNRSLDMEKYVIAVIKNCRNEGMVQSKKDYAGGIAGRAEHGAVTGSISFGQVSSISGSFVGGIAGQSGYVIRSCYALGALSGSKYVGGIAGKGANILFCASMPQLDETEGYSGAIAGQVQDAGELYGNYFVENQAGGIDGISYSAGAFPLAYSEFAELEGLPEEFKSFTVTFVIEGKDAATFVCSYGSRIPEEQIPAIPEKEGFYGSWPEFDTDCITSSKRLEAQYERWIQGLESSQKGKDGKPMLLVEGEFLPGWELRYTDGEEKVFEIWQKATEAIAEVGAVKVRYLAEKLPESAVIEILENGEFHEIDSERIGSYLIFSMDSPGAFRLVIPQLGRQGLPAWTWAGILTGTALTAVILTGIWKKWKRKENRPEKAVRSKRRAKRPGKQEKAEKQGKEGKKKPDGA